MKKASFCRRNRDNWRKRTAAGRVKDSMVKPIIVGGIGHDPQAFTQGLVFQDGYLYESTGLYGKSSLRKIDAQGNILVNIPVPGVFGEGIALYNQELVQLTWKEQIAVRYAFPSLHRVGMFHYGGEGWGLTNTGENFIMSNGSGTLYVRDGQFNIVKRIAVRLGGRPIEYLNELEFVHTKIYANVWGSDYIIEINYSSGQVERIIDCSELVRLERPKQKQQVLNGIAYAEQAGVFYITGKGWNNIFVVKIPHS